MNQKILPKRLESNSMSIDKSEKYIESRRETIPQMSYPSGAFLNGHMNGIDTG